MRVTQDALFLGCIVGSALLVVITAALYIAKKFGYLEETR